MTFIVTSRPYEQNFCFPYRVLENERVKLVPFDPSVHAHRFFAVSKDYPDTYKYMPYGPFDTTSPLLDNFVLKRIQPSKENLLFAVFNKEAKEDEEILSTTRALIRKEQGLPDDAKVEIQDAPYALAGLTGFLNSSPEHLKLEIGFVFIVPKFQKTHVTSNMVGLMLEFCFAPPVAENEEKGKVQGWGLGLRRVQWQANALNTASIRAAERMGFVREGTLRWDRVLPSGKTSNFTLSTVQTRCPQPEKPGRDTAILAIYWDEWEEKRGAVLERMERRA